MFVEPIVFLAIFGLMCLIGVVSHRFGHWHGLQQGYKKGRAEEKALLQQTCDNQWNAGRQLGKQEAVTAIEEALQNFKDEKYDGGVLSSQSISQESL